MGRSEGGNEVVLVRPDCAFGGVGAVVGEWDVLRLDGGGRLAEKIIEVLTRLIF